MDLLRKFKNWFLWMTRPLPAPVRNFGQEINVRGRRFLLEPATADDVPEMVNVERWAYKGEEPWAPEIFYGLLSQGHNSLFVLIREPETNALVGYIIASFRPGIKSVHISNVTIAPDWQGRGMGTFLVTFIMTIAKQINFERISLEVRVSNEQAIKLYRHLGFKVIRTRTNYYEDNNEDAYDMAQVLGGNVDDVKFSRKHNG